MILESSGQGTHPWPFGKDILTSLTRCAQVSPPGPTPEEIADMFARSEHDLIQEYYVLDNGYCVLAELHYHEVGGTADIEGWKGAQIQPDLEDKGFPIDYLVGLLNGWDGSIVI